MKASQIMIEFLNVVAKQHTEKRFDETKKEMIIYGMHLLCNVWTDNATNQTSPQAAPLQQISRNVCWST